MAATINDIVLIYFEDKPMSFARIEDIEPDVKRGWYHVRLLMLQVPLQVVTWILRDVYINGDEFTMNGKRMRIERVVSPSARPEPVPAPEAAPKKAPGKKPEPPDKPDKNGKVISLASLKKK